MKSSTLLPLLIISTSSFAFYHIVANIAVYEELGMDFIMRIQSHRSVPLDMFMRASSLLGFEFFFLLVPMLAWWGGQPEYQRISTSLFSLLCGSLFIIGLAKITFQRVRPLNINSNIIEPTHEMGALKEFSFPSGHAFAATSFFFLAFQLRKPLFWIIALLMVLSTCTSRIYFGVHYPHDVLAGLLCGVIFVFAFIFVQQLLQIISERRKYELNRVIYSFAAVALVSMMAINYSIDPEHHNIQQGLVFVPFCLLGFVLCQPFVRPITCVSRRKRVYRLVLGTPVIFSTFPLYVIAGPVARAFLAAFIGVWIFSLAPLVFNRFGLVTHSLEVNKNK